MARDATPARFRRQKEAKRPSPAESGLLGRIICCISPGVLPPYPIHYKNRLAEIDTLLSSLPAEAASNLVLLGDSLSERHPAAHLRGRRVVNMGISGDQGDHPEAGMLRRVPMVARAHPAEVFVLVGINDLNNGKAPEEVARDQGRVIENLEQVVPQARLFIQSVLPTRGEFRHLLSGTIRTNQLLRPLVENRGHTYVDLASEMRDADGQLREELTDDGVHLSPAGYDAWTALIEEL